MKKEENFEILATEEVLENGEEITEETDLEEEVISTATYLEDSENKTKSILAEPESVKEHKTKTSYDASFISYDKSFVDEKVQPLIYLKSTLTDKTGNNEDNKNTGAQYANILSIVNSKGSNSEQYVKAICGQISNKSGGDNDATGVVGYAEKMAEAGEGDTCGAGGAAWQHSNKSGLVLGGEFACHQQVGGAKSTTGKNVMGSGNNTLALHLTTYSTGSPCWGAIGIDGHGVKDDPVKHYGFWKGISIQKSCWHHGGNTGVSGTTGIDFSTNTNFYPENDIELGNAMRHFKRSNASIRYEGQTHDFCNNEYKDVKMRFYVNGNTEEEKKARNIQLLFEEGNMTPETGEKGDVETTNGQIRGGIISFGNDNGISIRTYPRKKSGGGIDAENVKTVAMSPSLSAFRPGKDKDISLGTANYRFLEVYTESGDITTSDARHKTEIQDVNTSLMKAWGKVSYKTFKMLDAVEKKGAEARIHIGLIAQDIIAAFESENLDAFKYGLVCKDTWDAEEPIYDTRTVKVNKVADETTGEVLQEEGVKTVTTLLQEGREEGEILSVRYDECLALEAAYQRWRMDQIESLLREGSR